MTHPESVYYSVTEWVCPTLLSIDMGVSDMSISKEDLERMIAEVIESEGFELVEMKLAHHGKHHVLRIFADRVGGITLDQCGSLSRTLERKLDEVDPFDAAYTLEVSSPGLDRPLTTTADFRRKAGKNMRLLLETPVNGNDHAEGCLKAVEHDKLVLETDHGVVELTIDQVKHGKILY